MFFYAVAVGMFGSVVFVCVYLFLSHYYVNVCAFAWIYFILVNFVIVSSNRVYDFRWNRMEGKSTCG